MPFNEKRLTNPTTLSTVASTIYTTPTQFTTIVKQLVVTNTTASAASFNLYIGSATSANALFSNTTVSGNDSIIINLSQVLSSTEILTASANANSALNITISGVENNGPLDPASVYIANSAITTSKIANNAITEVKLSTDVPLSGMRNKIINGDMNIAQRGTSAINTSDGYPVDRWRTNMNQTNTISFQQVAEAPAGFTNSVKATSDISPTAYSSTHRTFFIQNIEGFNIADLAWGTASAKPICVSFWVKVSAGATGTYAMVAGDPDGLMNYIATYSVTTTNWEYKTIVIPGPTSGTFLVNNLTGIQLNFVLGAGSQFYGTAGTWNNSKWSVSGAVDLGSLSSATWQVTGVQIERGEQSTPFEQLPYGVELALCQRYFIMFNTTSRTLGYFGSGVIISTGAGYALIPLPVTMRIAPVSVTTAGALTYGDDYLAGGAVSTVALVANRSTSQLAYIQATLTGTPLTTGRTGYLSANNSSTARLGFSAEL